MGIKSGPHISSHTAEIVLNSVKYETRAKSNARHGRGAVGGYFMRVDAVWLKWGMNFRTLNKSQVGISESLFTQ